MLVPITGLTVIATLNFGGRPFIQALAKELRDSGLIGNDTQQDQRIAQLTEQVEVLSSELHRLHEAQEFERALRDPAADAVGKGA